jgi:hypothetical protein
MHGEGSIAKNRARMMTGAAGRRVSEGGRAATGSECNHCGRGKSVSACHETFPPGRVCAVLIVVATLVQRLVKRMGKVL